MSVDFRKPVRLSRPIRGEAGSPSRRRIIDTAARLIDAETGEVLATAVGTYVAADAEQARTGRAASGGAAATGSVE